MNSIKNLIKQVIPKSWWKNIRHLKKWLYPQGVRRREIGFFHASRSFVKTLLKQHIRVSEHLDYPAARIMMAISTTNRFPRLAACVKEPETVAWLEKNIGPNDTLYDIGANVGAYSLIAAARTHGTRSVYAFEPNHGNFSDLCKNIALNGFENAIVPFYIALTDSSHLAHEGYTGIAADAGVSLAKGKRSLGVPSFALDALIPALSLKRPTLIKLDVDGAEMSVIQGAQKTFAHPKLRSVLVEINEAITPPQNILSFFEERGLTLEQKHRRGGTTFNYIFVRITSSPPTARPM